MKSYTDLEQSKKLIEILPIESADMCYYYDHDWSNEHIEIPKIWDNNYEQFIPESEEDDIPAWSLTALLGVIPYNVTFNRAVYRFKLVKYSDHWECYHENFGTVSTEIFKADNPVDACVAMIEKLHELNLL